MERTEWLRAARTPLLRTWLALAVVAAGLLVADRPARAGWDHWEVIRLGQAVGESDDLPPQPLTYYITYDGGDTAMHPSGRFPFAGQAWHFVPQPRPGQPDNLYQIRSGLNNRCITLVGARVWLRPCGSGWAYIWQRRVEPSGMYVLASTVNGQCLHYQTWEGARFSPVTSTTVVMDSVSHCDVNYSDRRMRFAQST